MQQGEDVIAVLQDAQLGQSDHIDVTTVDTCKKIADNYRDLITAAETR